MQYLDHVNRYIANLAVMFVKIHNLHWNVVGKQGIQLHLYTDQLYEDISAKYDAVAELLKMQGQMPLGSLAAYLKVATIKEAEDVELCGGKLSKTLHADYDQLRKDAAELRKLAEADDNFQLIGMMEEHIASYDKVVWFLSMSANHQCNHHHK